MVATRPGSAMSTTGQIRDALAEAIAHDPSGCTTGPRHDRAECLEAWLRAFALMTEADVRQHSFDALRSCTRGHPVPTDHQDECRQELRRQLMNNWRGATQRRKDQ